MNREDPILVGQGAISVEAEPMDATPIRALGTNPTGGHTGSDPHFRSLFDGKFYDVMGTEGFWAIMSTPDMVINAHFAPYGEEFTIIDQFGVRLPGTSIFFDLALDQGRQVVLCNHERVSGFKAIDPGIGDFRGGIMVLDRKTVIHAGEWIIEVVYCCDHGAPHPRYGKLDRPHLDLYLFQAGRLPDRPLGYVPHGLLGVSAKGGQPVEGDLNGAGVIDVDGLTLFDYQLPNLWATSWARSLYRW